MTIPDLRPDFEGIELEQCSVLLERLFKEVIPTYPIDEDELNQAYRALNAEWLRRDLMSMFSEAAFLHLYKTDFGKGVLVGAFAQRFMFDVEESEELSDY